MAEKEFSVEVIERNGETMLRVDMNDTSGRVNRVTDSTILTQSLEKIDSNQNNTTSETNENTTVHIEEGDIVKDLNAPDWSENNYIVVENITSLSAHEYNIENKYHTVSSLNPDYPRSDTVVECKHELDGDNYAYPISRLQLYLKNPETKNKIREIIE